MSVPEIGSGRPVSPVSTTHRPAQTGGLGGAVLDGSDKKEISSEATIGASIIDTLNGISVHPDALTKVENNGADWEIDQLPKQTA